MMRVTLTGITLAAAILLGAAPIASAQNAEPSTEDVLVLLVETYHQAVQMKDEARLRDDLYQGAIPGEDQRFLRAVFDRTEQLSFALEIRELDVHADHAQAIVDSVLTFRHATTGQQRTARYTLRLIFKRTDDGWRLERFERV